MSRALALAASLVVIAAALAAMDACQTIVGIGTPCDRNADCDGVECKNGFCDVSAPATGEGESGEGESAEGEGSTPSEGEGAAASEGEGEGLVGEGEGAGEGEGEGVPPPPPRSCLDLLHTAPGTVTGDYGLDENGDGVVDATFHCDMDRDGGGWTEVFLIDETALGAAVDSGVATPCPGDLQLIDQRAAQGFVGCRRDQTAGGARSAAISAPFPYTDVMGSVVGIMFGDADAFFNDASSIDDGIDAAYVDGASLTATSTTGARQHVFTFVGSHPLGEADALCPCAGGPAAPAFVGDQLLCATASCRARSSTGACSGAGVNGRFFDTTQPVWDGLHNICSAPASPAGEPAFFLRDHFFTSAQQLNLELRLMDDQASSDEDMALVHAEIYVR
ncbi:MAG TPA: fibrinogen-like YCDxxxxGGGW domain-containing protein [Myxococcota bacterium]